MRRCAAPATSRAPAERRAACRRRRLGPARVQAHRNLCRPWARWRTATLLAPLALAAPGAQGAAFLPGSEADPPTGEVTRPLPTPAEPLAGDGIQWTLAPWRSQGTLSLALRGLRLEDGSTSRQALLAGDVEFASHIWQPWFVQLRAGLGFVAAQTGGDAATGAAGTGGGLGSGSLTGRASVLVFPASRFPFELRADVGDSRTSGPSLGSDYQTRRLSLSQSWRPEVGNASLQLQVDHSQLVDRDSRDTLSTVNATALRQSGPHTLDVGLAFSDNRRSDTEEHTRLASLNGRHSYQPARDLNVETLASWNQVRLSGSSFDIGGDVRQLSTLLSWRPRLTPWAGASAPMLAATARWVQARTLAGAGVRNDAQAVNVSLGASQELTPDWRASVSASANHLQAEGGAGGSSHSVQAGVGWAPTAVALAQWRYAPSVNVNAGLASDTLGVQRQTLGAQAAHGLSRDWRLGDSATVSVAVTQGGAVLRESGLSGANEALAHGASVSWQQLDASGGQTYGGLSYSDSHSRGTADPATPGAERPRGRFQLLNLQFSQRWQLSRYAQSSAHFTLQGVRNESSELDVFTGVRRLIGPGWQRFYTGALNYEHQAAFGVPRLRHSVLLGVSSQPLEQRALGDIDAPRERISESLETRLDYAIGRLDTRLSLRVARVEGRVVAGVQARAQRRF
jgi:hypothetical protein